MKIKFLLIPVCLSIILILGGCKTADQGYDIRGTWSVNQKEYVCSGSYTPIVPYTSTITFTGSETSGTFIQSYSTSEYTGTYTVNNDHITIEGTCIRPPLTFEIYYEGNILNDNLMSGTFQETVNGSEGDSGTWTATRLNAI